MKRIILMLTVAAMMVVALTVAAPLAFADSGKNPAGIKIGNKSTNPNDGNGAVKNGSFKPGKKAPGQTNNPNPGK
jgi:hypothetical protein